MCAPINRAAEAMGEGSVAVDPCISIWRDSSRAPIAGEVTPG
jgi:hypothetical protein